jgi:hypothetical protein
MQTNKDIAGIGQIAFGGRTHYLTRDGLPYCATPITHNYRLYCDDWGINADFSLVDCKRCHRQAAETGPPPWLKTPAPASGGRKLGAQQ